MSGVYVPGMEMPKGREVIYIFSDGTAQKAVLGMRETLETSKAIPVPDHGRLIDADALVTIIENCPNVLTVFDALHEVERMPTIIKTDKEEKK